MIIHSFLHTVFRNYCNSGINGFNRYTHVVVAEFLLLLNVVVERLLFMGQFKKMSVSFCVCSVYGALAGCTTGQDDHRLFVEAL